MRRKFAAVLFSIAVAVPLFGKSLYWPAIHVDARLDADGRLWVRERQVMMFDGDWNGGERRFNLRQGQTLEINGITRLDNGRAKRLDRGSLSFVDDWDFVSPGVVRWRSRQPSDPPFRNQEITYVLDYVTSKVLEQSDDGHVRLQHDFAFPDRDGIIKTFSLNLQIDPAWKGLQSPVRIVRQNLAPGQSVVVSADLAYTGSAIPTGVHVRPSFQETLALPAAMLVAGILLTVLFYMAEARKGLFAPLVPESSIDEQWLAHNVFSLPPEAVGTAWNEMTGAPEVGAVIARMTQEKKLKTWVTPEAGALTHKPVLHLKLLVDWKTLPDAEQKLMEALFLGSVETDTEEIAQHYRSTGFHPESLIKDSIAQALNKVPEWKQTSPPVATAEIVLFVLAFLSFYVAFKNAPNDLKFFLVIGSIASAVGILAAFRVRLSAQGSATIVSTIFAWLVLLILGTASYLGAAHEVTSFFFVSAGIAGIFAAAVVFLVSRSRDSAAKLAFRRRLAAAREYFQSQLRLPNPNLRDEWYPYLVALGLGASVDQWFHAFPERSGTTTGWSGTSSSGVSGSSSSSSGWTGGGGAFGGAGASGSWAAMSALAGGVSAPSSSSGGGGGGGGSGGGGGGGW